MKQHIIDDTDEDTRSDISNKMTCEHHSPPPQDNLDLPSKGSNKDGEGWFDTLFNSPVTQVKHNNTLITHNASNQNVYNLLPSDEEKKFEDDSNYF